MHYLTGRYGVSTRRACRVIKTTRSSLYYARRKDLLTGLRQRMRELAQTRVRFGYLGERCRRPQTHLRSGPRNPVPSPGSDFQ